MKQVPLLLLFLSCLATAQVPKTYPALTKGAPKARVTKVQRSPTLEGQYKPADANAEMLIVYLETDDPDLDAAKMPLEKTTKACGKVEAASGGIYEAMSGGLLDGKKMCGYLISKRASGLTLRLDGYPPLKLDTDKILKK